MSGLTLGRLKGEGNSKPDNIESAFKFVSHKSICLFVSDIFPPSCKFNITQLQCEFFVSYLILVSIAWHTVDEQFCTWI